MSKTNGSDRRGFLKSIGAIGAAIIGARVVGESVEKPPADLQEAVNRGDMVSSVPEEPYMMMHTGPYTQHYS